MTDHRRHQRVSASSTVHQKSTQIECADAKTRTGPSLDPVGDLQEADINLK